MLGYEAEAKLLQETLHRRVEHTPGERSARVFCDVAPLDPCDWITVDLNGLDLEAIYAGLLVLEFRVRLGYGRSESVVPYAAWLADKIGVDGLAAIKLAVGATPNKDTTAKIFSWFIENAGRVTTSFDPNDIQAVFRDIRFNQPRVFIGV